MFMALLHALDKHDVILCLLLNNTYCPHCRDELRAAWAVFTPLLHAIDKGEVPLLPYKYGTRGPPQSDELVAKSGFVKNANYVWSPRSQSVTSAL